MTTLLFLASILILKNSKMKQKSKCPYCAHLFDIDESMIRKNRDIIKSDEMQSFTQFDLNEDVIQCPKCKSWLEVKQL